MSLFFFVCQSAKKSIVGVISYGREKTKVVSARISPAAPSSVLLKGEGISWMGDGGAPGGAPGGRFEASEWSSTRFHHEKFG